MPRFVSYNSRARYHKTGWKVTYSGSQINSHLIDSPLIHLADTTAVTALTTGLWLVSSVA